MQNQPVPSENRTPVLQARGLHKSYGSKPALRGVDLTLHTGEFVALLGPNGAGKSTLIQILSGLFVPDQGDLQVLGHDLRRNATRALAHLGVVFQQPSLDLDLSVQANLLFHTDLHGMPRATARERIATALAAHGLQTRARESVRALSGGNRRKVELIRALLHQPRFLLMDEATVGLDPASRQDLMQSVQALVAGGDLAVLWATHLVEEVNHASRLLILNEGSITWNGTPHELRQRNPEQTLEQAFLAFCQKPGTGKR